jgi:PhnB protein
LVPALGRLLSSAAVLRSTPFLLFDGTCAEAMTFYQECLGGELTLTTLGDSPMRDQLPPDKHHRIINAHLKCGDIDISATDWMASPEHDPRPGNTMSIFVVGDDDVELRAAFTKLSDGAARERFQPLHELPIGTYGQFRDRFGVPWIFLLQRHDATVAPFGASGTERG